MTARRDTPAPLDLLQQRRLHRGWPSTQQRPSPAGPLLRRGAALGAVPLVLVLALALAMQGRRWHLASQAEALSAVPAQRQLLDSRLQRVRRQLRQLERSNGALVRGIVAVQSGSALLTELQRVTPMGVQISALQVQGDQLQLKGAAAD
ncbi:MAG: PilN domain-containing protein, partial [Vulcanococcus sp.]